MFSNNWGKKTSLSSTIESASASASSSSSSTATISKEKWNPKINQLNPLKIASKDKVAASPRGTPSNKVTASPRTLGIDIKWVLVLLFNTEI